MSDDIDQAQEMADRFTAAAIEGNLRGRELQCSTGADCADCGDEIPAERRAAVPGCLRCVGCQTEHEMHSHWRAL